MEKAQQMIACLLIGFMLGLCVMFIMADIAASKTEKIWLDLVHFWRNEQVKAKREAVAAQQRWLDERQREMDSGEWWKHTED